MTNDALREKQQMRWEILHHLYENTVEDGLNGTSLDRITEERGWSVKEVEAATRYLENEGGHYGGASVLRVLAGGADTSYSLTAFVRKGRPTWGLLETCIE